MEMNIKSKIEKTMATKRHITSAANSIAEDAPKAIKVWFIELAIRSLQELKEEIESEK